MTKEAELRALRELTGANIPANAANAVSKLDDVAIVKIFDGFRRQATTIEQVDAIDLVMKLLFHQGVNRITGRVHGERVTPPGQEAVAEPEHMEADPPKTDRKAYMRELMRKRRAK